MIVVHNVMLFRNLPLLVLHQVHQLHDRNCQPIALTVNNADFIVSLPPLIYGEDHKLYSS